MKIAVIIIDGIIRFTLVILCILALLKYIGS